MDYGKSAYMKIEELERRLDILSAPKRERGTGFAAEPHREIRRGSGIKIGTLSGNGAITLNIKIALNVYAGGELSLFVGGKRAGKSFLSYAGDTETVMICSVKITEPTELSLEGDESFFALVKRVEASAFGSEADLTSSVFGSLGACGNGGETAVLYCIGDRLYFAQFFSGTAVRRSEFGGATAADIAYLDSGEFIAVYRDCFGGIWLGVIKDGEMIRRHFTGRNGDNVAVAVFDGGCVFAYTNGGKVYASYVIGGVDFSRFSGDMEIPCAFNVDFVGFVKGSATPMLIVGSGNNSFIKESVDGKTATADLNVSLRFTVENA